MYFAEEYSNHLGAADNFSETAVTGNGTATADATNHEMDLSTGIGAAGHAKFATKKTWTLGTKIIILNFIFKNQADGAGAADSRRISIGLNSDWTKYLAYPGTSAIGIGKNGAGNWALMWSNGSLAYYADSDLSAQPVNGDIITFVITSTALKCYINGTLRGYSAISGVTAAMSAGAAVVATDTTVTTAAQLSVDLIDVITYK